MNHMISYEAAVLLQDAGFSEELVEALVKFQKSVNGQIATSSELQSVKSEIKPMCASVCRSLKMNCFGLKAV